MTCGCGRYRLQLRLNVFINETWLKIWSWSPQSSGYSHIPDHAPIKHTPLLKHLRRAWPQAGACFRRLCRDYLRRLAAGESMGCSCSFLKHHLLVLFKIQSTSVFATFIFWHFIEMLVRVYQGVSGTCVCSYERRNRHSSQEQLTLMCTWASVHVGERARGWACT